MNIKTAALGLMLGASTLVGCRDYKEFKIDNKTIKIPKDSIEKYDPVFKQKIKYYESKTGSGDPDCMVYENLYSKNIYPTTANKFLKNYYTYDIEDAYREMVNHADASKNLTPDERINAYFKYSDSLKNVLPNIKKSDVLIYFQSQVPINKVKDNVLNGYYSVYEIERLCANGITDFPRAKKYDFDITYLREIWKIDPKIANQYSGASDKSGYVAKWFIDNKVTPKDAQNIHDTFEEYAWDEIEYLDALARSNLIEYASAIGSLNKKYENTAIYEDEVLELGKKGISIPEIEKTMRNNYVKNVIEK